MTKRRDENLKKALETSIGGKIGLSEEDFERLGIKREELDTLAGVYINQQYQISIIVDNLLAYPSLLRKVVELRKNQGIFLISLANTRDAQKPFIKQNGNCAYLYIK